MIVNFCFNKVFGAIPRTRPKYTYGKKNEAQGLPQK